jgi:hypothetical protein
MKKGGDVAIEYKFGRVRVIAKKPDGNQKIFRLNVTHKTIDGMVREAADHIAGRVAAPDIRPA